MAKLNWDADGERIYDTGVDRGVFYPSVGPGIPWNGLTEIKEVPPEFETRITYMDGFKVQSNIPIGSFEAQLSAITYPLEFEPYDGFVDEGWTGQARKSFNLTYRTLLANDTVGDTYGYQIHLVFNAMASPTSRNNETLKDSPEIQTFQWDISTTPVTVPEVRPAAHLVVDSTQVYPAALSAIEDILYGSPTTAPRFPTMTEVLDLFESFAIFVVVNHGDGTATISGPDSAVYSTGVDSAIFSWPSVIQTEIDTYRLSSL